jgi:hypothetical protein
MNMPPGMDKLFSDPEMMAAMQDPEFMGFFYIYFIFILI